MDRRRLLLALLALPGAALLLALPLRLRINTSASLPRGLYRLVAPALVRSSIVLFCPPPAAARLARDRGYLPPGRCPEGVQPLGKMILALPGDSVEISSRGLAVDGVAIPGSQPRLADSAGRPLSPAPFGAYRLGPRQVWVYAPHPRSFDSRYFGPVPDSLLLGTLKPVCTARSPRLAATSALLRSLGPPF
jgi:conjugative transfer signal peptidase TraF